MLLARDADVNVPPAANTVPKTVRYWGEFIYNVEPAESITEIYDIIDPATDKLTVNSSGQIGIGTTNPQAALDVTGAIRVSGGITPTYSSPSFSAGQVGYIYENNSFTPGAMNAWANLAYITIPAGVYVASAAYSLNNSPSLCYISLGISGTDSFEYQNSTPGFRNAITGIFTGPATIYLSNYVTGAANTSLDTARNRFRVIRIA